MLGQSSLFALKQHLKMSCGNVWAPVKQKKNSRFDLQKLFMAHLCQHANIGLHYFQNVSNFFSNFFEFSKLYPHLLVLIRFKKKEKRKIQAFDITQLLTQKIASFVSVISVECLGVF